MLCKIQGCQHPTAGKSSYCKTHRGEAHRAWVEKIQAESARREGRNAEFEAAFRDAWAAGTDAGNTCVPNPMIVYSPKGIFDDTPDLTQPVYYESEGVCGFAWVHISPGNCAAANYAKKHLGGHTSYSGGVDLWIRFYNQCYARKLAFARAAAKVLAERLPAIDPSVKHVYADGRLD